MVGGKHTVRAFLGIMKSWTERSDLYSIGTQVAECEGNELNSAVLY